MKTISPYLFVCFLFSAITLSGKENIRAFLGSRDTHVNIYKNEIGHELVAQIIEDSSVDDWNVIIIKGKSSLRLKTEIYTPTGEVVHGWINKSDCAVYARTRGSEWRLYCNPNIDKPFAVFNSSDIINANPYLYIIDYDEKSSPPQQWIKVAFIYDGKYYEGWTWETCSDINHGCN